jgi:hypothetical protein
MQHLANLALAATLILGAAAPARADFVQIGSNFDVDNTNFLDTFSQSVTFTGTGQNAAIDGGKLLINEQVFPTGSSGAWVEFNFTTAGGGPLEGEPQRQLAGRDRKRALRDRAGCGRSLLLLLRQWRTLLQPPGW